MIRIQWSVTTTIRDETLGGDTGVMDFSEIMIDATLRESANIGAMATSHPVEEGVDITDHVHPSLRTIALDCIISNTPVYEDVFSGRITSQQIILPPVTGQRTPAVFGKAATTYKVAQKVSAVQVLTFDDEKDRVTEVVARLTEVIMTGTRVDILGFRFGDLYDWVITNIDPVVETDDAVRFTLTAQEIRTANTLRVDAPSPRIERARRRAARGNQSGSDGSESATAEQRVARAQSAMYALASR